MWYSVTLAFVISAILTPIITVLCKKFKIYDYADARKIHTGDIPRLGSVAFVSSFCIASIIYFFVSVSAPFVVLQPLIFAGMIIFVFGVADDMLNLPGRIKLVFQAVAALCVVLSGHYFRQISFIQLPRWLGMLFSFVWIVGIINAFNLIDGMDGLSSTLSILILSALGIVLLRSARPAAAICFMLAAGIAGFLIYNFPPAKIFMGDGGSQFIGFMVASLPLYRSTLNFEYNKFLVCLVLVSIPLLDTIAAMWRRTREHRSFFSGDKAHIHHKLMNIGFSNTQILIALGVTQAVNCVAVGLAMYFQEWKGSVLLMLAFSYMSLLFSLIHYANRAVNLKNPKK